MLEHRYDFEIKNEDFYEDGTVRLSSLLFFCQEAATEHAELIGIGREMLLQKNIVWILTKMKVRITGPVTEGAGCYIMTYPREVKSRFCPRDYYMYNAAGEQVMIASAIWSLMDWTTRKVIRATEVDFGGEFRQDEAFPEGFEKVRVKEPVKVTDYIVSPEDIDENLHTNNCRYADMISVATDIHPVQEFVLQFSKETREGDVIGLFRENAEDGQMIAGRTEDGQTVFLAKVVTE